MEHAFSAVHFQPLLPLALIAILAGLCVIAVGASIWYRARGSLLRAASFAVLLAWLAGPMLIEETRRPLPDIGLLVVDQTASMRIGRRTALAEAARAAIVAQAAHLDDLELRVVTVPEGGSNGTRLFSAIDQALADIPRSRFAGALLVTDGQVHDAPTAEALARSFDGAPVNLLLAAAGEETDRRLRLIEAPTFGIVGRSVSLRLIVEDLGRPRPTGTSARLTLRRDGEPVAGGSRNVPVGIEQTIELPITRAGPTVVEVAVEKLPGEVSEINNRAVIEINGVRDRLRVLLISGEPHSGERTWRRLLKADPAVDLVHFTILRPPEKDDQTPLNELALIAFPVRELFLDKLDSFDLIVLDRFQNRGLLPPAYLGYIADHVRNGGALLLSVGPEFAGRDSLAATPLGSVLPARPIQTGAVIDGPFRPEVTAVGARHPVTEGLAGANTSTAAGVVSGPSWGSWYRRIEPTAVHGETLMSGPDGAPLLVVERYGRGRAALLLSDQIWLWSRGHQGGGPQAELLRRVAHWLMQEPELEENALTAHVADGRLHVERRSTDPQATSEVRIIDPEGHPTTQHLDRQGAGRDILTMAADLPGVWQASDGVHTAYAAAGAANPSEFADIRATATVLGPLARSSGGGIHWLDASTGQEQAANTVDTLEARVPELRRTERDRAASGGYWVGFQRRHDHVVTGIAGMTLLPVWIALPLLLGLTLASWRREGV